MSCEMSRTAVGTSRRPCHAADMHEATTEDTDAMIALATDFPGWHIWLSRTQSGRETGWNGTRRGPGPRLAGSLPMVAAADAGSLRSALSQQEALRREAAA